MASFDKGPPAPLARHFAAVPDIPEDLRRHFWYDWGPVFYRGRLSGSARVLGIASDPGPTERLVCRTLVGDAGQRVQGFLTRLGLTRSYVLLNAFPVAVHPKSVFSARPMLSDPEHLAWRNRLCDLVTGPALQAVVAFGSNAALALDQWTNRPDVPTFKVPHPSHPDEQVLLEAWRTAIPDLRAVGHPRRRRNGERAQLRLDVLRARLPGHPARGPPLRLPGLGRRRRLGAAGVTTAQQLREAAQGRGRRSRRPPPGVAGTDSRGAHPPLTSTCSSSWSPAPRRLAKHLEIAESR